MSLPSCMISQHGKELEIIDGYKIRFHKMSNRDIKTMVLCKQNVYSLHENRYE